MVDKALNKPFSEIEDHILTSVIAEIYSDISLRDQGQEGSKSIDIAGMLDNPLLIGEALIKTMAPAGQFWMLGEKPAVHKGCCPGLQNLNS